jgi:enamine deaminase RidA (YjgF/YER057c/UK114 family)
MPRLIPVNPDSLARPIGYSNGMRGQGELLFVAGQVGWTREGKIVSDDLVAQFAQALDNVLDVVWAAGGKPQDVARLTLYVTSKAEYVRRRKAIGEAYRKRMGKHFPAMTLVEVKSLLEDGAQVEIEATALV